MYHHFYSLPIFFPIYFFKIVLEILSVSHSLDPDQAWYSIGQGSRKLGKVLEFNLGPGKLLEFEKKCLLSWNFVKSSLKI